MCLTLFQAVKREKRPSISTVFTPSIHVITFFGRSRIFILVTAEPVEEEEKEEEGEDEEEEEEVDMHSR